LGTVCRGRVFYELTVAQLPRKLRAPRGTSVYQISHQKLSWTDRSSAYF
jgi:hypothetical protein